MRKQRASQSWPGKETWSWHQILCCSDEHLAAFLQLGRRRLTDIYLSTFTDLSSFQAGVTEIKEVCHRDPAALRHCLRSRAMHDALASHRQRLRLAGPGRRPCGCAVYALVRRRTMRSPLATGASGSPGQGGGPAGLPYEEAILAETARTPVGRSGEITGAAQHPGRAG